MRLHRIEIAQFRKLAGPVVLDGLGNGLAVVSGDNEEGKSTVLAALKAAFFEHHTIGGSVREAMSPHAGGIPEITVEFECGGERHRLRKAFRRGGVMLESGGHRHQDDGAERRLQELLRFERRQARSPRPENSGVQALFWVDQATAFRDFEGIAGGRDRLAAAIAAEVGVVAGGDAARRLLAVARERAATFYTAGRQQETGDLKTAAERVRELEQENAQLERRGSEFDARVDRLARLRADRARALDQDHAGRARLRCEAARKALAQLAELERDCQTAVEAAKGAAAEEARLAAQERMRTGLVAEEQGLAAALRALAERADAAERELDVLRAGADVVRSTVVDATNTEQAAERAAAQARDALAAARTAADAGRLDTALTRCRAAHEHRRRIQAALDADLITAERVAAARAAQQAVDRAAARLAAASTRLDFRPLADRSVQVEGSKLDPGQPLQVERRTEIELAGFGRIVVTPGGEDLDARQEALASAKSALAAALTALACPSLAAAEIGLERRREAEAELRRAEAETKAILQASATRSLEELAQLVASREAERDRLVARLPADQDLSDEASLIQAGAAAEEALDGVRLALAEARRAETASRDRLVASETASATLHGERQALQARLPELQARLEAERALLADEALRAARREAESGRQTTELRCERLNLALAAGDAEGLRERLAIAEREVVALEEQRRRLDGEIRDLEVALRESGADDWLERLAELPAALETARASRARLEREGRAWRLLAEKLAAADQSVRETLVAPVVQRLRPLLQRVFPGAEPVVDPASLGVTHLARDGAQEPFESLSIGAREQLAVLVRIAFAAMLAEQEGEAPCLILDDALVYADETRFATMKAILQRAAREMQILVLTCRPRDYLGLEASHLRLEDCRVGR